MPEYMYEVKSFNKNEWEIRKVWIKEWEEKDGLPQNARSGDISHVAYITDKDGHLLLDPHSEVTIRFYGRTSEGPDAIIEAKAQAEDYLRKNSEYLKAINSS